MPFIIAGSISCILGGLEFGQATGDSAYIEQALHGASISQLKPRGLGRLYKLCGRELICSAGKDGVAKGLDEV